MPGICGEIDITGVWGYGTSTRYGIGWYIRNDSKGRLVISHTGGSMGGIAHLLLYPKEGVVVALLVNSDQRFIHHTWEIADMFLTAGR